MPTSAAAPPSVLARVGHSGPSGQPGPQPLLSPLQPLPLLPLLKMLTGALSELTVHAYLATQCLTSSEQGVTHAWLEQTLGM